MEKVIELDGSYAAGSAYLVWDHSTLRPEGLVVTARRPSSTLKRFAIRYQNALLRSAAGCGYHALGRDRRPEADHFILKRRLSRFLPEEELWR